MPLKKLKHPQHSALVKNGGASCSRVHGRGLATAAGVFVYGIYVYGIESLGESVSGKVVVVR